MAIAIAIALALSLSLTLSFSRSRSLTSFSPVVSLVGASSVGAMSLPPGVGGVHSRTASTCGVVGGGRGGASDVDLISTMCQKISTDLGAMGADWESSSEILDLSQSKD